MKDQSLRSTSRWRFRLSVRGLIVFVLVIGAWLGWIVRGARIQREAVAAITRANGGAGYDWQMKNGRFDPRAKPLVPNWLLAHIGIDYFCNITQVTMHPRSMQVDATMAHVGRLSRLEGLTVEMQPLTDAGMANLKGLRELSQLVIDNTRVTDAGLAHLKGLTKLRHLDLLGTAVSSAGLAHLTALTKLSFLDLRDTSVSDAGLAHLERLPNLKVLHLASTQTTDRGLIHLEKLTGLIYVNLRNTQVSDAGLVHLKGLAKLAELNIDGTQVTKDGIRSLLHALPGLKIYHPRAAEHRVPIGPMSLVRQRH